MPPRTRRVNINVRCKVCNCVVGKGTPSAHPFLVNKVTSFENWLSAHLFTIHGLCEGCKDEESFLPSWLQGGTNESTSILNKWFNCYKTFPCLLETELRIVETRGGMFVPNQNTRVEYQCKEFRLRDGVGIFKKVISQRFVYDNNVGFVRRVSSIESWPISIFNVLLYTGDDIDFSNPRVMTRDEDSNGVQVTQVMSPLRIGFNLITEKEAYPFWEIPYESDIGTNYYEPLEEIVQPTRNTSEAFFNSTISSSLIYSPKLNGTKNMGWFTPNGMYVEDMLTHYITFIQLDISTELLKFTNYKYLVEVIEDKYIIIDVAVQVWGYDRVRFLKQLGKVIKYLEPKKIFIQQFKKSAKSCKTENPVDGLIVTPLEGFQQYKVKPIWTVDVLINIEQKSISSREGVVAFFTDSLVSETGVYECIINQGCLEIIRRRHDRDVGNDISEIVLNIVNSRVLK